MQKSIQFKNATISYTDVGKGNTIVLLHGFLENATMWNAFLPVLSKRNRVIAIDLLGHGKSDCVGYVHTMELFTETIIAVLKESRIRKVSVIGHSLGGYVALAFAEKYPEKIRSLCLLNSTSNADNKERIEIRIRAVEMAQRNYKPLVSMSIANLFQSENVKRFQTEIESLKVEAVQIPVQGYIAAQEGMKIRKNRNHILKQNTFKKLFIIGQHDPVLNAENLIEEAKETQSEYVVLDGGHMSWIENLIQLQLVLDEFIHNIKR